MVVTLPAIMILLDYWPLKRFELHKDKTNLLLWQLKEKAPFFILSAVFSFIAFYVQHYLPSLNLQPVPPVPLNLRLANAPVAFVTYLEKTFYPHNMAIYHPFPDFIPLWQVVGASLLIIIITAAVIIMAKQLPCLFTGWLWFTVSMAPVIGIIQISMSAPYAMADRYHYLPSIGLAVMLAWGIPSLFRNGEARKKILLPAAIASLAILSIITWQQCSYWKNSIELFSHALQVTKDNDLIYYMRGNTYMSNNQYELAIADYNETIRLKPHSFEAYNNRGGAYFGQGNCELGCLDVKKACNLGGCIGLEWAKNNGYCR